MKTLNREIKEHYDRTQKIYELFWLNKNNLSKHYGFWEENIKNLSEALLNENKIIADKLSVSKRDIILDAGCGVGGTAIWLAENYEAKVIGITLSQKEVGIARKHAKRRHVNHLVEFYVKDFCNTNFPDNSFTKIIAIESVCHANKKKSFLKETFRLLKPKGKLAIADFFIKENLNGEERKLIDEWCYGWKMYNLPTLINFQKYLKLTGFKNIECINKTKEIEPSSRRMYIVIGKFLRFFLKIMGFLKLHSSQGGTIAAINQYHIFKRGIAKYFLFFAEKS